MTLSGKFESEAGFDLLASRSAQKVTKGKSRLIAGEAAREGRDC